MEIILICNLVHCNREVHIKKFQLCAAHYFQQWRGVPFTVLEGPAPVKGSCEVKGCGRSVASKGLCATCYGRIRTYKVDRDFLEAMIESKCEICGDTERLSIDHDQRCCPNSDTRSKTCGKCVRGILCNSCNLTLSYTKDDPNVLRAMLVYLESR